MFRRNRSRLVPRFSVGGPTLPLLQGPRGVGVHSDMSTPDKATVARKTQKEFKTDFTVMMHQKISIQGYVPFQMFFREALIHPRYGYYSTKPNVIGGEKADFVTAAEVPFFGDVVCGWVMDVWQKMGTPRRLNLVELGPGKGSLMYNILRQIKHASPQLLHFLNVHLLEVGAARQQEQKQKLSEFQTATEKIKWWLDLEALPTDGAPMIIIANEFFDALPISRFQYVMNHGWLETYVDVDEDTRTEAHFKLVHAPGTSFTNYILPEDIRGKKDVKDGEQIEVCSYGMHAMEGLAKKMADSGKAALLVIDYGKDEHMTDTVRGIRGHKFVNPLLSPGDIDLSAWVSFKQLRWSLERFALAKDRLKWHPVITQADFLSLNGIDVRLASVIKDQETRLAMKFLSAFRRLTDAEEMGTSYKVFAVQTNNFPSVSPFF